MAALIRIAPHLRTVVAPHVTLKLVDVGALRSADDAERDGRMRVAAQTADFKIAVASIERVRQRWRRLGWPVEAEHPEIPRLAGELVGLLAGLFGPLRRHADRHAEQIFARLGGHAPASRRSGQR